MAATALVHPEVFDGYRRSQIFSLAHVCEQGMVVHRSYVYLLLKNIPGG